MANAAQAKMPNVVILLSDDLGWKDIGCYDGPVKTPALDRLASGGMRFTNFYSGAAVCSPSRAALLTGRTNVRASIYSWINDNDQRSHLPKAEVTIAEVLKRGGYATAHVGKWHLGLPSNKFPDKPTPAEHGFDYWFATGNNAQPSHHNPRNFLRNGKSQPLHRFEFKASSTKPSTIWMYPISFVVQPTRFVDPSAPFLDRVDRPLHVLKPFVSAKDWRYELCRFASGRRAYAKEDGASVQFANDADNARAEFEGDVENGAGNGPGHAIFVWSIVLGSIAGGLSIVGLVLWLIFRYEKKRTTELAIVADEIGMQFTPGPDERLLPMMQQFRLFNQGHSRRMKNVMRAVTEQLTLTIFDYQYTTGGGNNSHTHSRTLVALESAAFQMPQFSVRPESTPLPIPLASFPRSL